jgi:RNA polymerase sigma-70 factor (ECF subfamily)
MGLDENRFKELIHRQRDLIWRVCSSYRLSAAWTTEDAFHEVLCNLWRGFGTFDRRSSESTWVYRVAVNTMNSLARKMGNVPMAPPPEEHDPGCRDDDFRDLVELIESTPEPDRTIIKAHAQGYGYKEIAKITGLSIAAVSMRLTRALRKLRKLYNQK